MITFKDIIDAIMPMAMQGFTPTHFIIYNWIVNNKKLAFGFTVELWSSLTIYAHLYIAPIYITKRLRRNKPLEYLMRINRLIKLLKALDPDCKPGIPVRKILEELLFRKTGETPELFPKDIGMPFNDLPDLETSNDLLLRRYGINDYRLHRFILENLLPELVLFCSAHNLLDVFWLNGKQNAGQFSIPTI
jgi:hypothetical protein